MIGAKIIQDKHYSFNYGCLSRDEVCNMGAYNRPLGHMVYEGAYDNPMVHMVYELHSTFSNLGHYRPEHL